MKSKFKELVFVPVIVGSDINSYCSAKELFDRYGVKTHVLGKYNNGPCYKSTIIDYTQVSNLDSDKICIEHINEIASKYPSKIVIVFGNCDGYVSILSRNSELFRSNVIIPYINPDLMEKLQSKERFYELAKEYGLLVPNSLVYDVNSNTDELDSCTFPAIVKPDDGITHLSHPFKGQKKAYKVNSKNELINTIKKIYDSGYDKKLIIQDYIEGGDTTSYVISAYTAKDGETLICATGHVLLEEHTPTGIGNADIIISERIKELETAARIFLKKTNYYGGSVFDVKYNKKDGNFYFLELNTRIGRGHYYLYLGGINIMEYYIEEYIFDKKLPRKEVSVGAMFSVVPKNVAMEYSDNADKRTIELAYEAKRAINPLFNEFETSFERNLRLFKNLHEADKRFKKYME